MDGFKLIIEYVSQFFRWWIIVMPWQKGIRIRLGNKILVMESGIYLRIPFIDAVYIQPTRLRVVSLAPQTITTKDGKTMTIMTAIGYSIIDIYKFYDKLHHPEITISNMAMGHVAKFVSAHEAAECKQPEIEKQIFESLSKDADFGIKYEYVKVQGLAIVRTYRLIQDAHWVQNGIQMDQTS